MTETIFFNNNHLFCLICFDLVCFINNLEFVVDIFYHFIFGLFDMGVIIGKSVPGCQLFVRNVFVVDRPMFADPPLYI